MFIIFELTSKDGCKKVSRCTLETVGTNIITILPLSCIVIPLSIGAS